MLDIEKNDVDISKLFGWKGDLVLKDNNGTELFKVYVRLIGDADMNKARILALRESAKLRKELNDPNSDVRTALIIPAEIMDKEELIDITLRLYSSEISQDALRGTFIPIPAEPRDDSSLEEMEKYQALIDSYPQRKLELINAEIEKGLNKKKAELERISEADLFKLYLKKSIEILCEARSMDSFRDCCVFYGVYKDPQFKERLFTSFDEYANINTDIKNQLRDFYLKLELGSDDLKK